MDYGIDGCRAGWIAIGLGVGERVTFGLYPNIAAFWTAHSQGAGRICIDIPLGIAENGPRGAEAEARRLLKARRSSVFDVPVRAALDAPTYALARDAHQRATGQKFSIQAWNITPKIREANALLRADPQARNAFYEAHPELIFRALTGEPMAYSKKSGLGFMARVAALRAFQPGVDALTREIVDRYPGHLSEDDVIDALALAVCARIGDFASLPADPRHDADGIPMRMVYPRLDRAAHITRLNHAQITIPKGMEDAARAFYCGVLALREIEKPESLKGRGGFWLALGDVQVHIGAEDGFDRTSTKSHLAYEVRDCAYWLERLTVAGVTVAESVPIPGYERFEFRDPFGNRVEIIQPLG